MSEIEESHLASTNEGITKTREDDIITGNVVNQGSESEKKENCPSLDKDAASPSNCPHENTHQVDGIPDIDPREKAMTYLETSGAIRMFQELAAEIVKDRPANPFHYMMDTLKEKGKKHE
ncbi:uncharacterized protein LOC114518300 isoform X2 [Dendronephthya gigantea]|uniref:uncharacterized protein LOC114518300 isoform X2 n=1 Tax=Dendronephthya gigantea TaxID=151771 RepID=UPI00106AA450|nr:uncharacterized protein LOC114518300 isoform X2 [Dendronephthya gigantea]